MDEIKVNKFELDLTGTEKNLLKGTEEKALAQGLLDPKEKEKISAVASLATANASQILRSRLAVLIKEFQKYPGDTGSTPVQIAILTEKINHITNVQHKKDKRGKRYLTELFMRRRALLKYLRKKDALLYEKLLVRFNINRDELNNVGRSPNRQIYKTLDF